MIPYKDIEHTADAGLVISGRTLRQLFEYGARGMTEIMARQKTGTPPQLCRLVIRAENLEELFLKWLRELLYLFSSTHFVFVRFKSFALKENELNAEMEGARLDLNRDELGMEIKAVTYHQFYLKKTNEGFEAQVIFDV